MRPKRRKIAQGKGVATSEPEPDPLLPSRNNSNEAGPAESPPPSPPPHRRSISSRTIVATGW